MTTATERSGSPIRAADTMRLDAPAIAVWQVLTDFAAYPRWYPRRVGMSVVHVAPDGIGTELRLRPLGGRSFHCRVETLDQPHQIRVRYHGDFIAGTGEWLLEPERAHTRVTYRVDVVAHGLLATVLGRVIDLVSVHSNQMRAVMRDLGAEVRRRAVSTAGPGRHSSSRSVHP